MKTRTGFVSNSSSSSFMIVGISDDLLMKQIAEKDGKFVAGEYQDIDCSYGIDDSGSIDYYGSWGEPCYMGIDISNKIEKKILPELKEEFQQKVQKEYGINIPSNKIKLYYGEVGDG